MNKLDIFGSQVSVRFQGSSIHKTKFGAFLTMVLFLIIMLRLGILIYNVLDGRNPTVLFQERQVQDPKKFVITPDTLSLAIGVLDTNYNYYIDNSLFTIQGVHKTKQNVYNQTTGQYDQIFQSRVFNLVNCTDDNVPDPKLREYFLKSQLYMHQCIPKDMVLEIEGQFNSDFYQELNFYFYKCTGNGCKDEKQINALVNNNNIELLFTDVYFAPENKDNPFVKFSRDLYWITSQNLPREANVFLRNNYVESDFGWITSDITTQVYPSFSYNDDQIVDPSNQFFFHLVIRFEKEKENLYKRTYDNLFTIMSQIGGFSQILLTVFSFIGFRYSEIHLSRSLINQSLDFQDVTNKPNQGTLISNPTQVNIHPLNNNNIKDNNIIDGADSQGIQKQIHQKQATFSHIINEKSIINANQLENANFSPIFSKDIKYCLENKTNQNQLNLSQMLNKKNVEDQKQKLSEEDILQEYQKQLEITQNYSKLKFNVFSYMLSFATKAFKSFRNKKKIIDYAFKEIDNNLDIEYIIKKFVEIDKLKRILLNDDQLTLFNLIPKPQILYKVDQKQGVVIEKNSLLNNKENLSNFEQFKKAKQSFKNIYGKQKQTKIDLSILNLIDDKQYQMLSNQLPTKQSQQNYQQQMIKMQNLQNNFPYNLEQSSSANYGKNQVNQDEGPQDSSEDYFDQNKIKKYSTLKKVRNPSLYSSTSNQERNNIYQIQDYVEEHL
ncbi:small GTP-binding domain protein (macronuclear) [Tetrahymena thermophila SB210]|uniref:Small GTP-binding domain protein n=1 Tax=Tetrahymena thermophila (strain SB210) TaxID=312017 RepID=Q22KF6_TETTS|nr:small GTP-binding domain protein [Tetrahymena thermophila SB210]EAR85843.1 small GTP-binding domain protein [Tetrahymena thermophila SB210]|eukprot:XP_001033506.1 small GTP-binding domain protein [Tetrahymena thermophila SB210]